MKKRTVFKKISAPKGLVLETKLTEKIFFSAIFRLPDVKRAQKIVLTFSNQFTINPLTAVVAILRHKSEGGGYFPFFGHISVNIDRIDLKPGPFERKLNSTQNDGVLARR